MSILQNNTRPTTSYGKKAMIYAIAAAIAFIFNAVLAAYGIMCSTSVSICLPTAINTVLSGIAVFLLVVGTLAAITGILYAVESITVMERTTKSYIAITVLLFSVLGIVGNVYQFLIFKAVGFLFHRGY